MRGLSVHTEPEILALARLGKRKQSTFIPNTACALLFANDPRMKFPGCLVRILRFDGEAEGTGEKFNAVKDFRIEGNVPSMIIQAAEGVLKAGERREILHSPGVSSARLV